MLTTVEEGHDQKKRGEEFQDVCSSESKRPEWAGGDGEMWKTLRKCRMQKP